MAGGQVALVANWPALDLLIDVFAPDLERAPAVHAIPRNARTDDVDLDLLISAEATRPA